jgi:phage recombination protein Bet
MSTPQTAVATIKRPSLITSMAGKYNIDPGKFLETLKATILPKATDEEMQAFCIVANAYALNPFLKEIHAFPNKSGGITPVVGVDGWCSLMNRRPEFDGIEFEAEDVDGKPHSVTASIYIKGRNRPIRVTEYYSECFRNTDPWNKSPRRMLRHKALIQGARIAFGFSGIHDEDEAERMAVVTDVQTISRPVFKPLTKETVTSQQESRADAVAAAAPAPEPVPGDPPQSPQDKLAAIVTEAGYTFDDFANYCASSGFQINNATAFSEVPIVRANQMIKAQSSLIAALGERKESVK